jgi:hypothetical protein
VLGSCANHKSISTVYRTFVICEPKPRQISAAPYRDRVVHHALVNVLEPIYERTGNKGVTSPAAL